ncbi:hypothetical protein KEM52_004377 [Ascosphaera acerosa]|nr:hypothetical protein KEM52_004377 [Ascosphaera acerosa]
MLVKSTVLLSLHLLGALAAPRALGKRASTCTPANGADDDTPAIESALKKCGDGGTIVLPQGKTYNIASALSLKSCQGCTIQLDGTLKVSTDLDYWAQQSAIISVKGVSGMTFTSPAQTGIIDGNGQDAWDAFASNKKLKRPKLILVSGSTTDSVFSQLHLKNPPMFFIGQNGDASHIRYESLTLTAESKSSNPPKNTDGIDIGQSKYTTIRDVHITNYDDCIAFKPGCDYLEVYDVTCAGNSHGLSVGSLGKDSDDTVTNVYLRGAHMINATKAAGIKLYDGSKGHGSPVVRNVTWEDVHVDSCDYAAQIQSCYGISGDNTCEDTPSTGTLEDIKFINFHGETSKKYAPVDANINCPGAGSCDIAFPDWKINTPSKETAHALCAATPDDLGINCKPGAFRRV